MPETGLTSAGGIRSGDALRDTDGDLWRVSWVTHGDDGTVWLALRKELSDDYELALLHLHAEAAVGIHPLAHRRASGTRVLWRGLPWWVAAMVVAVLTLALGWPSGGGAFLLIVVLWLGGAVAMVTTPERDR